MSIAATAARSRSPACSRRRASSEPRVARTRLPPARPPLALAPRSSCDIWLRRCLRGAEGWRPRDWCGWRRQQPGSCDMQQRAGKNAPTQPHPSTGEMPCSAATARPQRGPSNTYHPMPHFMSKTCPSRSQDGLEYLTSHTNRPRSPNRAGLTKLEFGCVALPEAPGGVWSVIRHEYLFGTWSVGEGAAHGKQRTSLIASCEATCVESRERARMRCQSEGGCHWARLSKSSCGRPMQLKMRTGGGNRLRGACMSRRFAFVYP